MKIHGIHHVTAITSSAERIYDFFTRVLGLRLVKKTVNQDDIYTYHLFFADDQGSPGTDMTFFDFLGSPKAIKGTDEIAKTGFRVQTDLALSYWEKRFDRLQIRYEKAKEITGLKCVEFYDFDDQSYMICSDENHPGVAPGHPWKHGPIPDEYAIIGLGPIYFRVSDLEKFDRVAKDILGFKRTFHEGFLSRYEVEPGGLGASLIVEFNPDHHRAVQGFGGIHHLAFRISDLSDIQGWINTLNHLGYRHSGHVNRFYFHSLYTRLYPNMLFEFATDGPGFIDDEETYETLGEKLSLPPQLRKSRAQIETLIRPIDTSKTNQKWNKEY